MSIKHEYGQMRRGESVPGSPLTRIQRPEINHKLQMTVRAREQVAEEHALAASPPSVAASDSSIRAEAEEVLITPLRGRKKNKTKGKDPFKPGWNLVRSRKKGGANE